MATFFSLPMGPSLAPLVKHNDQFPEFAQKYPNLDRMTPILATGQFRAYQRSAGIATYKEDMRKFSEEGAAFRAHQQLVFQSDVAYLTQADDEIKELEKNVSAKSGKLNTTQAYKKQQELQRSRLGMMKTRRFLLQQDYDLRKEIEEIDIAMTSKHSQIFELLFRIKENTEKGISDDPEVAFDFVQLMPSLLPLNHAKEPLRVELERVRTERAELERTMDAGRT